MIEEPLPVAESKTFEVTEEHMTFINQQMNMKCDILLALENLQYKFNLNTREIYKVKRHWFMHGKRVRSHV